MKTNREFFDSQLDLLMKYALLHKEGGIEQKYLDMKKNFILNQIEWAVYEHEKSTLSNIRLHEFYVLAYLINEENNQWLYVSGLDRYVNGSDDFHCGLLEDAKKFSIFEPHAAEEYLKQHGTLQPNGEYYIKNTPYKPMKMGVYECYGYFPSQVIAERLPTFFEVSKTISNLVPICGGNGGGGSIPYLPLKPRVFTDLEIEDMKLNALMEKIHD